MIHTINGDITTATSGIVMHQVNCQGVMGSGVALAIRTKWPTVFEEYQRFCRQPAVRNHRFGLGPADTRELLGQVLFVGMEDLVAANLFAQDQYGKDGHRYTSYDALDTCLIKVRELAEKNPELVIHFPLLGCGTGGGHWPVVREIIEHRLPDPITKNLWIP